MARKMGSITEQINNNIVTGIGHLKANNSEP